MVTGAVPRRPAADGAGHHRRVPGAHVRRGQGAAAVPAAAACLAVDAAAAPAMAPRERMTVALEGGPRERRVKPGTCCSPCWSSWCWPAGEPRPYPLMDTTEARYGEIGRKMLETATGSCRSATYGVPFWGKPPLSIVAARGVDGGVRRQRVRGAAAVAAAAAGCGALVFVLAAFARGRDAALWAVDARSRRPCSCYLAAGAVMTDAALALGTTLSMAGFWIAIDGPPGLRRAAGCRVLRRPRDRAAGQGPGRAGPDAASPLGAWTLWTSRWRAVWSGAALVARHRAGRRARRALVLGRGARVARASSITS